jgi:exonuclease III
MRFLKQPRMMVQKEKKKRKRWMPHKGKGKENVSNEASSSKPMTKGKYDPSHNEECFHFHRKGHWLRNFKKYLEDQKKENGNETSTSGINIIEINIAVSSSDSWVFNTGSMIHTCKLLQGLSMTRRFAKGELNVRVGRI